MAGAGAEAAVPAMARLGEGAQSGGAVHQGGGARDARDKRLRPDKGRLSAAPEYPFALRRFSR
jgi:hypothetical protein